MPAHKRGFTLVELLVVIAIIAVLSTVGLVTYSTVQKAGRTSKRIQDLKAIQTALELYYSVNKKYPVRANWIGECNGWAVTAADNIIADSGFVPQYMPAFPSDPAMDKNNGVSCYLYRTDSDGKDYKLLDYNINEFTNSDYLSQRNLIDPAKDGGTSCSKVDPSDPPPATKAWAIYSSNTGKNEAANPACWE